MWTDGIFTITNFTVLRTLNASSASLLQGLNFLATLIIDVRSGVFVKSQWDLTFDPDSIDRNFNAASIGLQELIYLLATIVYDSPSIFTQFHYTAINHADDFVLNVTAAGRTEFANVLSTFLIKQKKANQYIPPKFVTLAGSPSLPYTLIGSPAKAYKLHGAPGRSYVIRGNAA